MTRKKFIKKCYRYGIQRNEANRLASMVHVYKTYDDVWNKYKDSLRLRYTFDKASKVIKKTVLLFAEQMQPIFGIIKGTVSNTGLSDKDITFETGCCYCEMQSMKELEASKNDNKANDGHMGRETES